MVFSIKSVLASPVRLLRQMSERERYLKKAEELSRGEYFTGNKLAS